MTNGEKYKNEIKTIIEQALKVKEKGAVNCKINSLTGVGCGNHAGCNDCKLKALIWLLEEYEEPILTEEGKEFLKQLIAPFISNGFVCICIKKDTQTLRIDYEAGFVNYSKKVLGGKWDLFKNLDFEFHYTSKELGL